MTRELLQEARRRGIQLRVEDGQLAFSAPKGAMDADFAQVLKQKRGELIRLLSASGPDQPIPVQPRTRPLPVSFAQMRMWFLWCLDPESAAYCAPVAMRIDGQLDVATLERSCNTVRQRHEILRSYIIERDGEVMQEVHDLPLDFLFEDMLGEDDAAALARISRKAKEAVDLRRAFPFQVRLYRVGPERHFLLIRLHHIAYDGWSNQLLMKEIWQSYSELLQGRQPALPTLRIQYSDFAVWQREQFAVPEDNASLRYWIDRLKDCDLRLDLAPLPRGDAADHRTVAEARFVIPESTREALARVASKQGATMFMTVLAVWRVLLSINLGRHDFVIGTPAIQRSHPDCDGVVGYFGNTLLMRNAVATDETFSKILKRERDYALASYSHQEVPLDLVVENLLRHGQVDPAKAVQVMLLYGERAPSTYPIGDLRVEFLELPATGQKFGLGLWIKELPAGGFSGHIEYSPREYSPAAIACLATHFTNLMVAAAHRPDDPIEKLSFMSSTEQAAVAANLRRARERAASDMQPPDAQAEPGRLVNAQQRALAEIWSVVLKRPIDRDCDFFEAGGNSLSAMAAVAATNRAFQTRMSLRSIFDLRRLSCIADMLVAQPQSQLESPLTRADLSADVPTTLLQQNLWRVDRVSAAPAHLNLWQTAFLPEDTCEAALEGVLAGLRDRHPLLRTRFPLHHRGKVQRVDCTALDLTSYDLTGAANDEFNDRIAQAIYQAGRLFDLDEGPCWRVATIRRSNEPLILMLVVHHILADEWTLKMLVEELSALALLSKEVADRDQQDPPFCYADYSVWEREARAERHFQDQLDWWLGQLVPQNGTKRTAPALPETGRTEEFTIPSTLWNYLAAAAGRRGATMFTVALGALMCLLGRLHGEPLLRICTNHMRRHRTDTAQMLGPLNDLLVISVPLADIRDPASAAFTAEMKLRQCRDALDVPFMQVLAALADRHQADLRSVAPYFFMLQDEGGDRPGAWDVVKLTQGYLAAANKDFDLLLTLNRVGDSVRGAFVIEREYLAGGPPLNDQYIEVLEEIAAQWRD